MDFKISVFLVRTIKNRYLFVFVVGVFLVSYDITLVVYGRCKLQCLYIEYC